MQDVSFFLPGPAVPKARPRVTKEGHVYTPDTTAAWEAAVKKEFLERVGLASRFEQDVAIYVWLLFICPGTGPWAKIRGDVDNYAKAVLDALNELAYRDDIQIVDLRVRKRRRQSRREPLGVHVNIGEARETVIITGSISYAEAI